MIQEIEHDIRSNLHAHSCIVIIESQTKILKYEIHGVFIIKHGICADRLCGLVVRVPGYRSGGPGFDSRHYKKK
jgi:hypothetical protein